jgi:hypothetical protein
MVIILTILGQSKPTFYSTLPDFHFLGAFAKLREAPASSSCVSVCLSAWNNWAPNGRIFIEFGKSIFRKSADKIHVSLKYDKNNRYFT